MSHDSFVHTHRVTYADCAMGNHIYYSRYLEIFEAARGEFFRHLGLTFKQLHEADTLFPVVEAHLRYRSAARYDDVIRIELWLTALDRVRIEFAYRVLDEARQVIIDGRTLHACASMNDRMKRIPQELADRLRAFVAPPSPTGSRQ
jgi:acyl-CoA thioester hydrolase